MIMLKTAFSLKTSKNIPLFMDCLLVRFEERTHLKISDEFSLIII